MRTPRTIVLLATAWLSAGAFSQGCGGGSGGTGGTGGTAGHAAGASGTGGHGGTLGTAGAGGKAGAGGAAGAAGGAAGVGGGAGAGGGKAGAGGGTAGAGGGSAGAGGGSAGAGGKAGAGGGSGGAAGSRVDAGASDGPVTCTDGGTPDGGVSGSRIVLQLDPTDPERVTNLQWLDSASTLTANLVAQGGPAHCTDPQEFFGQSYGAPEGTLPYPVVGGHLASLATCGARWTITSAAQDCTQTDQIPVTTSYQFHTGTRASEVQVTRTFGFGASTPVYSTTGLRPYVPRLPIGTFGTVIYPNQAGAAVTSGNANSCGGDCFVAVGTTWNGRWFADVAASGLALIVLRDPSMTSPVQLTVNNDASSGSNLTSFVLVQPTAGWTAPVTEIEHLCFADLTTWPQAQRDAAVLPASCGP